MPLLEVRNVHKGFQGQLILSGISFTLDLGSVLVVYGDNGVGKTTLLRIIAGLLRPDRGFVILLGKDIYRLTLGERIRFTSTHVAFGFQEPIFITGLSILENIVFTLRGLGASKHYAKDIAMKVLDLLNLKDKAGRSPLRLSSGERKRADIARAIAKVLIGKSRVLILDEPTSYLDEYSSNLVVGIVKDLIKEKKAGTIISTTYDEEILKLTPYRLHLKRS